MEIRLLHRPVGFYQCGEMEIRLLHRPVDMGRDCRLDWDLCQAHPPSAVPQPTKMSTVEQETTSRAPGSKKTGPTIGNKTAGGRAQELRKRVYRFSDLSSYGLRSRFLIRCADLLFYAVILIFGSTIRWEVRGEEHLEAIYDQGRRAIFTFWHSCIFPATWFWRKRGIVVMSSRSRDGEYIARFIQRFGYGAARGSSSRGAGRALAEMVECMENGIDVAFTIDGPRGPVYVAKDGAVILARHAGHGILPFHIAMKRYLEAPSWDRLQIPLPFTRAVMLIAEPVFVGRDPAGCEPQAKQAELQATLDRLRAEGEEWRRRALGWK